MIFDLHGTFTHRELSSCENGSFSVTSIFQMEKLGIREINLSRVTELVRWEHKDYSWYLMSPYYEPCIVLGTALFNHHISALWLLVHGSFTWSWSSIPSISCLVHPLIWAYVAQPVRTGNHLSLPHTTSSFCKWGNWDPEGSHWPKVM